MICAGEQGAWIEDEIEDKLNSCSLETDKGPPLILPLKPFVPRRCTLAAELNELKAGSRLSVGDLKVSFHGEKRIKI